MINLERHVKLLLDSSAEDWAVAGELLEKGRMRHALFFAHLAIEKLLKALVVRRSSDIPPRLHNLVRLAELAGVDAPPHRLELLADLNPFNLAGRYPETLGSPPRLEDARAVMVRAKEVKEWLQSQL